MCGNNKIGDIKQIVKYKFCKSYHIISATTSWCSILTTMYHWQQTGIHILVTMNILIISFTGFFSFPIFSVHNSEKGRWAQRVNLRRTEEAVVNEVFTITNKTIECQQNKRTLKRQIKPLWNKQFFRKVSENFFIYLWWNVSAYFGGLLP